MTEQLNYLCINEHPHPMDVDDGVRGYSSSRNVGTIKSSECR